MCLLVLRDERNILLMEDDGINNLCQHGCGQLKLIPYD